MQPAAELLPVVYAELRRLAAALTGRLPPGQTLQPTALVHEAYLRLVGDRDPGWEGRRHFFGAAARAMREILIEQARRKGSRKHGGGGPARRADRGPGHHRAAGRRPARPGRGDPAAPGGEAAPGRDRHAPLLRRAERGGDRRRPRRVGEHRHREWRFAAPGWPADWARAPVGRAGAMPVSEPGDRVQDLFDQALELPPAQRDGLPGRPPARRDPASAPRWRGCWLTTRASPKVPATRAFLKSPLVRAPRSRTTARGPTEPLPAAWPLPGPACASRTIAILGLLGEGGMGTVYEAEQDSPRRPVALKVVRPGLASPALLKRFTHEAQILGRLHHPGIAQVYEAGLADDGQPFFAMEFIRGLPLDEYANRHGLDLAARVGLVARVCDAVQHAHDQGVIHRDLKPANILVEETGQPKVLDFGVARATDADLLTAAGLTRTGQLLGTPNYMSPEQVTADPAAIDHRADVYALGVILFELAAHRLPYRLEDRPLAEAARLILEQDPPRLGSIDPELRGDVETIVAKALEKDPARRYPSAADLAADLRRWLAHEPILARPPSALYHLRKFARRHTGLVGGVVATGVALVLGLVGTILFAVGEARQRGQAEHNARQAIDEKREAQFQAYRAGWPPRARRCRATTWPMPRASSTDGPGGPARLGMAAPAQPARRQLCGDPVARRGSRLPARRPGPTPGRDP